MEQIQEGFKVAAEHSPLEQFEIHRLIPMHIGHYDVSFNNSAVFMVGIVLFLSFFMIGGMSRASLVPGRWQMMVESSYEFVANMIADTAGAEGRKYFPFVFTLFMFILCANVVGLIPFTFAVTSHIIVTFAFAAVIFLGVTLIGFAKHGTHFLQFFVPKGVPAIMLLILVPIEIISYLTRPMSLSVRLFANMMAGHTMLKVFGGFVVTMGLFGILPLVFIVALSGLELVVALLQAYVFAVLTCIYLNDALHMH